MPDLNFDPLFTPTVNMDDNKREPERVPESHGVNANDLTSKSEVRTLRRNEVLGGLGVIIDIIGSLLIIGSVLMTVWWCIWYMGVF